MVAAKNVPAPVSPAPSVLKIDYRTAVEELTDELEKRLEDPQCRWHKDLRRYAAILAAAFPKIYSEDPEFNRDFVADRRRKAVLDEEKSRLKDAADKFADYGGG